ncbi:MAG TPA: hypothetical protein VI589_00425 [Vicinamibacteria bacterium]
MRSFPLTLALTTAVTLSVAPMSWAADPFEGTWDLDANLSRYNPGPARKSEWRTYRVDGKTIHMVGSVTFADGTSETIEYSGAYDGKDYPVRGNPRVHAIAQTKVDDYTVRTTTKRDGNVTATSTRVVSKDGQTMTVTTTGTTEKGVAFDNALVFHKRSSP